ncbi:MAG TPA: YbaK/EbsC family protein [Roseiflexaceae bacterium]|nr:YbaK/EbsC family protein [Roseiflexaceae bacterium]
MTCKDRLETYLRDNQVAFETQHHRTAFTAQALAESEHIPGRMVAKVVMIVADGELVMLALPATNRVDVAQVAAMLDAREVRLADEAEFTAAFPDCEIGAMPPFGNLYGVPVYIDQILAEDETIYFQAGTHTDTISLKYADFARLVEPTVADFARHMRAVGGE